MALVETGVARIREAAAKLPPESAEKPDSAIDAGIRKTAINHPVGDDPVTVTTELVARVDELLAPPKPAPTPEAKQPAKQPAETKPATA